MLSNINGKTLLIVAGVVGALAIGLIIYAFATGAWSF